MTPEQFIAWRKAQHWSRSAAAEELGISASQIQDYESGFKRGTNPPRAAKIPRTVALACAALSQGVRDYPG